MPVSIVKCPNCNTTLKPKTPVPEGTRLKCPKCATVFVVAEGDVPPTVPAPPKPAAPRPAAPPPAASKPATPRPRPGPAPAAADEEITEAADDAAVGTDEGEAPARPKKKKMPMWAWFAIGGGALLLLCCCGGIPTGYLVVSMMGNSGNVSKANLDKIKKDMTEAQVKAIMGEPSLPPTEIGGIKSETWKNGDDFITIGFMKDKAVSSAYQLSVGGGGKLTGGGQLP